MIQTLVFGVQGTFVTDAQLATAGMERVGEQLANLGFDPSAYRAGALLRYQISGTNSLFSRTCRDLSIQLPDSLLRRLTLTGKSAIPDIPDAIRIHESLWKLQTRFRLAFLDAAAPPLLDGILEQLDARSLAAETLWTQSLGAQATPPSHLGFRWLQARLRIDPNETVYLGNQPEALLAAKNSAWHTWQLSCSSRDKIWIQLEEFGQQLQQGWPQ